MSIHTLYIPINSTSLAHYWGRAIILPAKYYSNKPDDIQNRFEGSILCSDHFGTNTTNCCLEILLTEAESKTLVNIGEGFYLFNYPIPISRVKKIYFDSPEKAQKTISNVNESDAFIPQNLIGIAKEKFDQVDLMKVNTPSSFQESDQSYQIKEYDRIMGGLALMKVAHNEYMNYSENYFSTLSLFCAKVQNELEKAGQIVDKRFHSLFQNSKFAQILRNPIDDSYVSKIAREEGQRIQKNPITKLIDLDKLDKTAYIVAVLNTFGVEVESKRKRLDSLVVNNFHGEIKSGKEEGIALSYGINRGYSALRNSYATADKTVTVKYKLDNLLDYYTIESVYSYVFNSSRPSQFDYLNWVPERQLNKHLNSTDYIIIDEYVIGKKKPSVSTIEYITNLLKRFFSEEAISIFNPFVSKLRDIIYHDTCDEINSKCEEKLNELIASHEVQMKKCLATLSEVTNQKEDLSKQINSLRSEMSLEIEQLKQKIIEKDQQISLLQSRSTVPEGKQKDTTVEAEKEKLIDGNE